MKLTLALLFALGMFLNVSLLVEAGGDVVTTDFAAPTPTFGEPAATAEPEKTLLNGTWCPDETWCNEPHKCCHIPGDKNVFQCCGNSSHRTVCCRSWHCCEEGFQCCGASGGCCEKGKQICCLGTPGINGDGCCDAQLQICCHGSCCTKGTEQCCSTGGCCPVGHTCCKKPGRCCPPGHTCCECGICCRAGYKCCGKTCCLIDHTCCEEGDGFCCHPYWPVCCASGKTNKCCCPRGTKCQEDGSCCGDAVKPLNWLALAKAGKWEPKKGGSISSVIIAV